MVKNLNLFPLLQVHVWGAISCIWRRSAETKSIVSVVPSPSVTGDQPIYALHCNVAQACFLSGFSAEALLNTMAPRGAAAKSKATDATQKKADQANCFTLLNLTEYASSVDNNLLNV